MKLFKVRKGIHLAGKLKSLKSTVVAWSFQQKVVAGVTAAALVTGSTTAGIIVHRANAAEEPEIEVVEEEIPEEVEVVGNKVEIPSFTNVSLSSDSMVQDLKLYFKDDSGKKITGVPFAVVITTEKKAAAVAPSVKTIDLDNKLLNMLESTGLGAIEYNKALGEKIDGIIEAHAEKVDGAEEDLKNLFVSAGEQAAKEEDGAAGTSTDEEILINAATDKPITVTEFYLIKKQNDIASYATALSDVDGKKYSDDDGDGIIKIDKIDGGKYITLCVPQNGYDAKAYENKVTVKAELEYKKVENIKDEVVKDAGDTKPADAAQVEAKLQDTVEYVKSSKESNYAYTAASAPGYKASGNGATEKATADGGKMTVSANGGTLYAVNGANSLGVSVGTAAGNGTGTFSNMKATAKGVKVSGENGNYTISVDPGTKSTTGTVTFSVDYTYKAAKSAKATVGNKRTAAAKKIKGGFITAAATTNSNAGSSESESGSEESGSSSGESGSGSGESGSGSGEDGTQSGSDSTTTPATPEKFTVTFDSAGGSAVTAQEVEKDAKATKPTDPTKENATFDGWYNGNAAYDFNTPVTGNVTLTAHWKTVTYEDKKETITITVNVKVVGADTKVTATDGQKLYSAQDTSKVATLADVVAGKTLYTATKTNVYTGWQAIDGKSYYFTKDHQKVTGDQVIQGVKYSFNADGVLVPAGTGVDVSKWQGNINWDQLSGNVSFAIIRCGYRGSSGGLSVDPQYAKNMKAAKAHGVKVGIYIYSKATNEAMAVEEASLAIQLAQEQGGVNLPIYMDMEDGSQKGLSQDQATSIANAFCATVASAGYRPGVYASYNWWNGRLNAGGVNGSKWVARYNTQCGMPCDIWQYSSKGTLPGISGNVDMNQSYF